MPSTFTYTPLPLDKSIRLLRLDHDADHEPITCYLQTIDHYDAAPIYHCLSYCWGSETETAAITCDGHRLAITQNLHAALRQIRRRSKEACCRLASDRKNNGSQPSSSSHHDILLWVDALCIDQENIEERNQQVAIMHKIFQNAGRVNVWLGAGTDSTFKAEYLIRRFANILHDASAPDSSITAWLEALATHPEKEIVDTIRYSDFSPSIWKAYWDYMKADWFHRVWVIQEVRQQNAVLVLCGQSAIEWPFVCLAAWWMTIGGSLTIQDIWDDAYTDFRMAVINTSLMWDQAPAVSSRSPFLQILDTARYFKAKDSRDKIFAMLHFQSRDDAEPVARRESGLPSLGEPVDSSHLRIEVDYRLTTFELYRHVAVQSLHLYNNTEVLSFAWKTAYLDTSWPSWIPRWDVFDRPIYYDWRLRTARAGGDVSLPIHLDSSKQSLSVVGVNLGNVVSLSKVVACSFLSEENTDLDPWEAEQTLRKLARLVARSNDEFDPADMAAYLYQHLYRRDADTFIAIADIVCDHCAQQISSSEGTASSTIAQYYKCDYCDHGDFDVCVSCFENGKRCRDEAHTLHNTSVTSVLVQHVQGLVDFLSDYADEGDAGIIASAIGENHHFSDVLTTSEGRQGLTSGPVAIGDTIAIVFGSAHPYILRKRDDAYRLVGVCFVEDYMDGEAVEMWEAGELSQEVFEIR